MGFLIGSLLCFGMNELGCYGCEFDCGVVVDGFLVMVFGVFGGVFFDG